MRGPFIFDRRRQPWAVVTCDFVTMAAGYVCLHALDFVGEHPGRLVDGEGPEQHTLDGLVTSADVMPRVRPASATV
jgi:hypothetical protein